MNDELLQTLRDIHEPAPPAVLPPAPGWWLLLVLVLVGLAYGLRSWRARQRRLRPYRHCRRAHAALSARLAAGEIDARGYVDGVNELLKRLLVRVEHHPQAARASGAAWLAMLARRFDEPAFLDGPGTLIGVERFRARPEADVAPLVAMLTNCFERRLLP